MLYLICHFLKNRRYKSKNCLSVQQYVSRTHHFKNLLYRVCQKMLTVGKHSLNERAGKYSTKFFLNSFFCKVGNSLLEGNLNIACGQK